MIFFHNDPATSEIYALSLHDALPMFTCPAPVTVFADLGQCSATNVVLGTPATGDNCAVSTVVNNLTEPKAVVTNPMDRTLPHLHGNQNTCTQQVIVVYNHDPTLTCTA